MTNPVDGWTDARFQGFIISTLRGGMRRYPPKWKCLKEAYVGKYKGSSGRDASHYKCAECGLAFTAANVQIDHLHPVVDPSNGFTTWDEYISRLFCSITNLQVLCKPCHKVKTQTEKLARATHTTKPVKKPSKKRPSTTASKTLKGTSKAASGDRKYGTPSRKRRSSS